LTVALNLIAKRRGLYPLKPSKVVAWQY